MQYISKLAIHFKTFQGKSILFNLESRNFIFNTNFQYSVSYIFQILGVKFFNFYDFSKYYFQNDFIKKLFKIAFSKHHFQNPKQQKIRTTLPKKEGVRVESSLSHSINRKTKKNRQVKNSSTRYINFVILLSQCLFYLLKNYHVWLKYSSLALSSRLILRRSSCAFEVPPYLHDMHVHRNRKNAGLICLALIALYLICSSGWQRYEIEAIIKNAKAEDVWNYVADFSKMRILNPTM